ncbi:hypothetical protein CWI37_2214p0010 [Hamiltosporidium tvaerminnensis]|uniref:J domain-containing protein n=1 Tax=Hamiltosporidium tvaerminnensis TaxID=1176355 RepID=A0A4Q9KS28_9MICR|nr:hypothetical protein LUQ84_002763 [Hamiltosporidium tvaerminnensis]TBT97523.1 hypothetical protein CWI37_2214p0010 [Hamiltosporidium tvaerminnensis]
MGSIQNYFEIFKIKPSFDIQPTILQSKYHELCKKYHPDISSDFNIKDGDLNIAIINNAYKTLLNDYKRAIYLYKLNGNHLNKNLSTDFLNEILFTNETIDMTTNIDVLNKLKEITVLKINECKNKYNDSNSLIKWKYYDRMLKNISNKIEMLM